LPTTNTLAYSNGAYSDEEKVVLTLAPGANVLKLFSWKLANEPNKLVCLSLTILASLEKRLQLRLDHLPGDIL